MGKSECPSCGAAIGDDAAICTECGKEVRTPAARKNGITPGGEGGPEEYLCRSLVVFLVGWEGPPC